MIEFNGYLTDSAQDHFFKRTVRFAQNLLLSGIALLTPIFLIYLFKSFSWSLLIAYCAVLLSVPIMCRIKTKKGKKRITPKKIYINDDTIVCIADTYTESQFIEDVKEVYDYGEFYVLEFPFGKYSEKYVCQKNLLIKGTFEEFEALFEGKIIRKSGKTGDGGVS